MIRLLIILVCVAFAVARFALPFESVIDRGDFFKDAAHLFVGGLIGAASLATSYQRSEPWADCFKRDAWSYWVLAIAMTVLEVVAFKFHQQ